MWSVHRQIGNKKNYPVRIRLTISFKWPVLWKLCSDSWEKHLQRHIIPNFQLHTLARGGSTTMCCLCIWRLWILLKVWLLCQSSNTQTTHCCRSLGTCWHVNSWCNHLIKYEHFIIIMSMNMDLSKWAWMETSICHGYEYE